jgi:hypothetical protein
MHTALTGTVAQGCPQIAMADGYISVSEDMGVFLPAALLVAGQILP